MSRILSSKKRFLLGVAASLAVATAAFAYWTTSGEDSGTTTTGTDQGVTISGDPADGIYPGGEAAVTVNIDNDSATQSQRVKYLHVEVDPVVAACDASWFTFQLDEDTTVDGDANPYHYLLDDEIAGGADADYTGKVFMSNPNVDQDACKTSDLTINYDVNNDADNTP